MSKTVLITGTSTGLGIRLAIQAAQAGHSVYATMRNLDKRATLDAAATEAGVDLTVLALDVQKIKNGGANPVFWRAEHVGGIDSGQLREGVRSNACDRRPIDERINAR